MAGRGHRFCTPCLVGGARHDKQLVRRRWVAEARLGCDERAREHHGCTQSSNFLTLRHCKVDDVNNYYFENSDLI
eukprot:6201063-Pleurochrysis_carterae.AAC.6